MIVVFTGGRNFGEKVDHRYCKREAGQVQKEIDLFNQTFPLFSKGNTCFVGCARGLDALVRAYAQDKEVFEADWAKKGRAAGPIRNSAMLAAAIRASKDKGIPMLLVAYPGGNGTEDCTLQARRAGFPLVRVELSQA